MKTAISIPDPVFEAAEELAGQLGISRSKLYSIAVAEYISAHHQHEVSEKLDAVYSQERSKLDEALLEAQLASVTDEEW